jgi:hypothetical protein
LSQLLPLNTIDNIFSILLAYHASFSCVLRLFANLS